MPKTQTPVGSCSVVEKLAVIRFGESNAVLDPIDAIVSGLLVRLP